MTGSFLFGQPPDADHGAVGDEAQRGAPLSTTTPAPVGVAGDHLALEADQQQHEPGRGDRQPGAVDGPGLTRLQLGRECGRRRAGSRRGCATGVRGRRRRPRAQCAGLDDPVPHRVGQPLLEPVEALAEPAAHLVVDAECRERRRAAARGPGRSWDSASGSDMPGSHGRSEVVDGLRPHLGELAAADGGSPGQHREREVAAPSHRRPTRRSTVATRPDAMNAVP